MPGNGFFSSPFGYNFYSPGYYVPRYSYYPRRPVIIAPRTRVIVPRVSGNWSRGMGTRRGR
jgi:hypothetical protein